MFERLLSLGIRFRVILVALWAVIAIMGAISSINLESRLTTSLEVPKSGSQQAELILNQKFHEMSEGLITIINHFGTLSKADIEALKKKTSVATRIVPNSHLVQQQALAGTLFTVLASNSSLQQTSEYIEPLRSELKSRGLSNALVSGAPAIYSDVRPVLASDLRRGELIAVGFALILLIVALGFTWAVFIPLIFASTVVLFVLGVVNVLSHHFTMVLYIPNIVELIGFGLSVDYSLLAVQRFREEVRKNPEANREDLVVATMRTAGKTILTSGITVALALATLLFFPIPFIQSLGIAVILVPIGASLLALTLLPTLLLILGVRGLGSRRFQGFLSQKDGQSKFFAKLSTLLLTKPKQVFISTLLILATFAAPVLALQVTPSSLTTLPSDLESSKALTYLTSRVGDGIITPVLIIVDLGNENASASAASTEARRELAKRISRNPEVLSVAQGDFAPYVDSTGRYYRIFVFGKHDVGSAQMQNLVLRLKNSYLPEAQFADGFKFYIGGAPAQGVDLLHKLRSSAPVIFLLSLLIIALLLGKAFHSILLPIKAIALDLISISVALGLLVIFFKYGLGSKLFGTYQLPQIEVWALLFLVVILFGISMDYEVFMVSRIRESWVLGGSNEIAVIDGFGRTMRVVTTAAMIFVAAVSGFISGHFAGLQELGVGLAAAILIDATLIRLLLLPSAMILLGRLNWWMPKRKSRHL